MSVDWYQLAQRAPDLPVVWMSLLADRLTAAGCRLVPPDPAPDLHVVVFGLPGPQGSKTAMPIYEGSGTSRRWTGRTRVFESSKKVTPWRDAVRGGVDAWIQNEAVDWTPLDGSLTASMVFSLPRPRKTRFDCPEYVGRPAGPPDLSKLLRATEDAITQAKGWRDDARVVEYRRLAKVWAGSDDPDALPQPGAVIRIWRNQP